MRHLLCAFIGACIISACTKKAEEQYAEPQKIIISGQILHANDSMRRVQFAIGRHGKGQEEIGVELDSAGRFNTYFDSYAPVDLYVIYQTNFLVIAFPGDSLHLVFDGNTEDRSILLSAISISGDHNELNSEVAAFQKMYFGSNLFRDWDAKETAVQKLDPVQYKRYADSLYAEGLKIYDAFDSIYHPGEEAKRWAKAEITESYFGDVTFYPQSHRISNKLDADWQLPQDYYDYFKQKDFSFDSSLFASDAINGYSNKYLSYVWSTSRKQFQTFSEEKRKRTFLYDSLVFANIISHTNNTLLKEVAITEMLTEYLEGSMLDRFEHFKPFAEAYIKASYLKKPLFEEYENLISLKDVPPTAYKKQVESIKPFFVEQISKEFRGKVVYVDVWAIWCSPCRGEFKYSNELHNQYGDSIAFVYICVDSDEEAFQSTVKKYDLKGTHYFLDNEQSKELYKQLKMNGVPHYILIDHLGKVVSKGFEYRPSESIAQKKLKDLVQQSKQ